MLPMEPVHLSLSPFHFLLGPVRPAQRVTTNVTVSQVSQRCPSLHIKQSRIQENELLTLLTVHCVIQEIPMTTLSLLLSSCLLKSPIHENGVPTNSNPQHLSCYSHGWGSPSQSPTTCTQPPPSQGGAFSAAVLSAEAMQCLAELSFPLLLVGMFIQVY